MGAPVLSALTGWLLFTALVGAAGSAASIWLVVPRASASPASSAWMELRAARFGRWAATLLVPALLLVLVRQVIEFRDPFAPLAEDVGLLMRTSWGRYWAGALAASILALAGFWTAARGRRAGRWLATAAVLALAFFPGLTGHAGGTQGGVRWLTLPADALHVLAAGSWLGGLGVVLGLERSWRRSSSDEADTLLPTLVPLFSPVAMASVALLVVTGAVASWAQLPGIAVLWESAYGRWLVAKLVLVGAALGLGAFNWRRLTPKLSAPEGPPAMRRAAALELGVGTVVLLITAVLVRTSPLGH